MVLVKKKFINNVFLIPQSGLKLKLLSSMKKLTISFIFMDLSMVISQFLY